MAGLLERSLIYQGFLELGSSKPIRDWTKGLTRTTVSATARPFSIDRSSWGCLPIMYGIATHLSSINASLMLITTPMVCRCTAPMVHSMKALSSSHVMEFLPRSGMKCGVMRILRIQSLWPLIVKHSRQNISGKLDFTMQSKLYADSGAASTVFRNLFQDLTKTSTW